MTGYIVQSIDNLSMKPIDNNIIGTFTTRGRALDECAEYIMERIRLRDDLAWSMAHDERHPEAARFFSERKDGCTVVNRGCVNKLYEYIRDMLGRDGGYYVDDTSNSWYFEVAERDVVGELWHTVTWGDSDCEDPEFTTPYPEAFTSEETAVETFIDYVKDLYRDHCMKWSDEFLRETRKALKEDGKVQVDLNDGTSVSCVLYHDDAKNIKE